MNLTNLGVIASSIIATEKANDQLKYAEVFNACAKKHNDFVDMVKELEAFIESNMAVFENGKEGWKFRNREYHTDYQIGSSNPYNCVLRDKHHEQYADLKDKDRIYFVDKGIYFHLVEGKCVFVTDMCEPSKHGYGGEAQFWNNSRDANNFFFYPNTEANGKWETNKTDENCEYNEFTIAELKKKVDADYEHILKVVNALTYSLKAINESILNRLNANTAIKESATDVKRTKVTIEVITESEG